MPEFCCRLRTCHLEFPPPVGDDAATVSGDTVAEPPYTEPQLTKMAAIESWMKGLSLNRKLFELCLPGSHDAGVYRDLKRNYTHEINPGAMTRCQNENIREQAMCGSRVFDIRVFLRKDRFLLYGLRPMAAGKHLPLFGQRHNTVRSVGPTLFGERTKTDIWDPVW